MLAIRDLRAQSTGVYQISASKTMLIFHHWRRPGHDQSAIDGMSVLAESYPDRCPFHFLLRADGVLDYLVPVFAIAPHARDWSSTSIGVAVAGDLDLVDPTGAQWHTAAQMGGVFSVLGFRLFGHSELRDAHRPGAKPCPGKRFCMESLREQAAKVAADLTSDDAAWIVLEAKLMDLIPATGG